MITVLDVFCGGGGITCGLLDVNTHNNTPVFKIVGAIDKWSSACQTFASNHGVEPVCDTVNAQSVKKAAVQRINLYVGGCPCQNFSTLGDRALDDPRNQLVVDYLEGLRQVDADAFVFENVSGFMSFQKGKLLGEVVRFTKALGYQVTAQIVAAGDYGVPQRRQRCIIVGTKNLPPFVFPAANHPITTFRDAVSDLPEDVELAEDTDETPYSTPPQNSFQKRMRVGSNGCVTDHFSCDHSVKLVTLMEHLREGESATDAKVQDRMLKEGVPEQYLPRGSANGKYFGNTYARIYWDKPAPTITRNFTTPSSSNCVHPSQPRALTIREGARCQSFPDTYKFCGTHGDKRLLIGNAVPPLLGTMIGEQLTRCFDANQ